MSASENPPAFPNTGNRGIVPAPGMTIRDWFAGQALAGLVKDWAPEEAAESAYAYADALLSERAKNTGEA